MVKFWLDIFTAMWGCLVYLCCSQALVVAFEELHFVATLRFADTVIKLSLRESGSKHKMDNEAGNMGKSLARLMNALLNMLEFFYEAKCVRYGGHHHKPVNVHRTKASPVNLQPLVPCFTQIHSLPLISSFHQVFSLPLLLIPSFGSHSVALVVHLLSVLHIPWPNTTSLLSLNLS